MNKVFAQYEKIVHILQITPRKDYGEFNAQAYLGSTTKFLGLKTVDKRNVAKQFKKDHPELSFDELVALANLCYQSNVYEVKTIPAELIKLYKNHLFNIQPQHIKKWLMHSNGWAEIDTLCQSTFPASFFLKNWKLWKITLINFSNSKHIQLRRASLVLLVKSVRSSRDKRFVKLGLENVNRLKHEKDILITKAVSWLLREMVKLHKQDVQKYLDRNEESLPKIAARELKKKITTGKK